MKQVITAGQMPDLKVNPFKAWEIWNGRVRNLAADSWKWGGGGEQVWGLRHPEDLMTKQQAGCGWKERKTRWSSLPNHVNSSVHLSYLGVKRDVFHGSMLYMGKVWRQGETLRTTGLKQSICLKGEWLSKESFSLLLLGLWNSKLVVQKPDSVLLLLSIIMFCFLLRFHRIPL